MSIFDAMVIAPATACTLAKMATGVADNMLVTSYLSTRAKVFAADIPYRVYALAGGSCCYQNTLSGEQSFS